jgi:hypothetical protein
MVDLSIVMSLFTRGIPEGNGEIPQKFLHLSSWRIDPCSACRLPSEATDASLRKMCHCFGLQAPSHF